MRCASATAAAWRQWGDQNRAADYMRIATKPSPYTRIARLPSSLSRIDGHVAGAPPMRSEIRRGRVGADRAVLDLVITKWRQQRAYDPTLIGLPQPERIFRDEWKPIRDSLSRRSMGGDTACVACWSGQRCRAGLHHDLPVRRLLTRSNAGVEFLDISSIVLRIVEVHPLCFMDRSGRIRGRRGSRQKSEATRPLCHRCLAPPDSWVDFCPDWVRRSALTRTAAYLILFDRAYVTDGASAIFQAFAADDRRSRLPGHPIRTVPRFTGSLCSGFPLCRQPAFRSTTRELTGRD